MYNMFLSFVNFFIYVSIFSCIYAPIPNGNGEIASATESFDEQVKNELDIFNTFANDISNSEQRGEFKGQLKMLVRRVLKAEAEVKLLNFEKGGLNTEKDNHKKEILKYRKLVWKVVPRVFFDDVEGEYKPRYDAFLQSKEKQEKQHRNDYDKQTGRKDRFSPLFTQPTNWPSRNDPKALRIRKKADMWCWFFTNLANEEDIKDILKGMETSFRQTHQPRISEDGPLTDELANEFERFKEKTCKAIGIASETSSFIIHGNQALDLFKGELKELNVYGSKVDPYLVPVLNALVPLVDEDKDCAIFKDED